MLSNFVDAQGEFPRSQFSARDRGRSPLLIGPGRAWAWGKESVFLLAPRHNSQESRGEGKRDCLQALSQSPVLHRQKNGIKRGSSRGRSELLRVKLQSWTVLLVQMHLWVSGDTLPVCLATLGCSCWKPHAHAPRPLLLQVLPSLIWWHDSGFLGISTIDILEQIILRGGGCPVHRRLFSSVPGLHRPDVSSIPQ